MEGTTVFTPSLEGMKNVRSEQGVILTKPFLEVCKLILPVIEKFGAAMTLVKSDIGGNITRLENKYSSDPSKYEHLYTMVQEEVAAKTAKASSSCTNGLLWLTRAMDFLVELFRNLLAHADWTMSQCCSDSYSKTLKKYHGWLASSSFSVAMKLAPDRKKFMDVIAGTGDVCADMEKFCASFPPFLEENHKFLKFYLHNHHQICRDRLLLPRNRLATRMGTKVKGLLKGLRYISQIFDEKEGEMEIGFPTDVKHVSHIGWDGPSANAPSWMNEFKPSEDGSTHSAPEEMKNMSSNPASEDNSVTEKRKPRSRRPSKGEESPFSSPARSVGDVPLKHRRRRSTNTPADSPRDESGSIRTRRSRNSTNSAESPNVDDQPAIPKHSRTRKSKVSGGSTKSKVKEGSPSTNANNSTTEPASEGSCSGSVQDKKNTANHLTSVLEAYEER